jgi:tetratricopeptide (TPR) repeat protein
VSTNETNETNESTSPASAEANADANAAPAGAPAAAVVVDQAALAQKVDALLGEADQLEELARQEEAKLEARTGGRGKSALEEAAAKRLAEIGSNNAAKKAKKAQSQESAEAGAPQGARRQQQVSAALDTPDRWADFVQKNRKNLTTLGGVVALGLAAFGGFAYYGDQKRARASEELAQAYAALDARIVTPEQAKAKPADEEVSDGPTYGSADERAEAAIAKFESVEKSHAGTGAAYLAELTRASVLASQGKYEEALKVYESVRKTPLGKADVEISLRAAEGMGAAHEGLAFRNPDRKKAELEAALASYKQLIDSDALGFAELGQYHTARVYEQQGEVEKAKELYRALHKKLTKPAEERPLGSYLEAVVTLRLQAVDPSFEPPRNPSMGGSSQLDEAQIKKLLEELKKKQGAGGPVGDGH